MTDEARYVALLRFGLDREGVSSRKYAIALLQESDQEDCIMLRKTDDEWQVYYVERGKRKLVSKFERARDAITYCFWYLTNPTNPWSYLKEFESSLR